MEGKKHHEDTISCTSSDVHVKKGENLDAKESHEISDLWFLPLGPAICHKK